MTSCRPCLIIIQSCYFDCRINKPFALSDPRLVICSRDLDVLHSQRIIGFFNLNYPQFNEVGKSDHIVLLFFSFPSPLHHSVPSLLSFSFLLYSFLFFLSLPSLPSLLHCFSHSLIPFAPLLILIFSFSVPLFLLCCIASLILSFPLLLLFSSPPLLSHHGPWYIKLKLQFSRQDSEHLSQVSPLMMLR